MTIFLTQPSTFSFQIWNLWFFDQSLVINSIYTWWDFPLCNSDAISHSICHPIRFAVIFLSISLSFTHEKLWNEIHYEWEKNKRNSKRWMEVTPTTGYDLLGYYLNHIILFCVLFCFLFCLTAMRGFRKERNMSILNKTQKSCRSLNRCVLFFFLLLN